MKASWNGRHDRRSGSSTQPFSSRQAQRGVLGPFGRDLGVLTLESHSEVRELPRLPGGVIRGEKVNASFDRPRQLLRRMLSRATRSWTARDGSEPVLFTWSLSQSAVGVAQRGVCCLAPVRAVARVPGS